MTAESSPNAREKKLLSGNECQKCGGTCWVPLVTEVTVCPKCEGSGLRSGSHSPTEPPKAPQLMNHDELVKEVLRLRSSALPLSPPNALPWRELINEALACGHDNCEGKCERAKLARGLIGRFEFMEALTIPIPPSPDLTQPPMDYHGPEKEVAEIWRLDCPDCRSVSEAKTQKGALREYGPSSLIAGVIHDLVRVKSDDELARLRDYLKHCDKGNCWWAIYWAQPTLLRFVESEIQERKRVSGEPGEKEGGTL